ncbi:MAG: GTP cyclohydrolase I [Aggregatilineales bacterium]
MKHNKRYQPEAPKQAPIDDMRLMELAHELLHVLGEDPEREGLRQTPRRWASWWKEFIEYEPGNIDTAFEAITSNQLVVVSGIRVYSICEHHLLPFWCDVSIGYIVCKKVLGLSKFARIAQQSAHKLQLQERMVGEIADEIQRVTESPDVAVAAHGIHLCMLMRGIRTGAEISSLITRGAFSDKPEIRSDFMRLAKRKAGNTGY